MPPKKAKDVTDEIAEMKKKLLNKLSDGGADLDDYKKRIADEDDEDEDARRPPKKAKKSAPAPPEVNINVQTAPSSSSSNTPVVTASGASWQTLLGGEWVDFTIDLARKIEDAYAAGDSSVTLPPQRGQVYCITFSDMKQTNTKSKKQRPVRRTEPAGKATSLKPPESPPRPTSPCPGSPNKNDNNDSSASNQINAGADEDPPPLESATYTLEPMDKDSDEFWDLEEKFRGNIQGRNEDYVAKRLEKKLKPISFVLKSAEKIVNPVLEKRFAIRKAKLAQVTSDKAHLRERTSFHGTHPRNIANMCKTSLLRFKHPLNPCKSQVDDGYFGTNKKGVYVSRYADYTVKYANRQVPLEPSDTCKIIQFRTLPGRSKHIPKMCGPIDPTDGYDSHSSPSFLEWYLFNEDQLLPEYVLHVQAREDTRTAADDM
jgi:hypothetical protein